MDEIENDSSPDEHTLVDLIERAQRNFDPEAFDGLYLLFADRVFRYLLARLGDAETAEEITAQVFVRLIEKIHIYQIWPKDNVAVFSAWLYRMAHNKMVDVVRARKRDNQVALEHARHVAPSVSLSIVDTRLDLEEIQQKLQYLNDPQRDVIVLRFIEELSIAETAQIMQKSEAAVKALQQRALENLRRYLDL
jgi:RNA polymerase sigma-70 factor (ECF subfamily)